MSYGAVMQNAWKLYIKSSTGFKTRPFNNVLREVQEFTAVASRPEGTIPGGVHFETTGQRRDGMHRRHWRGEAMKHLSGNAITLHVIHD